MPYVTIEVLQDDVDSALRDRRLRSHPASFCPVARAACRALGLVLGNVRVGGNTLSIWGWKAHDYLYITATKKLEQAVTRFDREREMEPASFRIDLTPPVNGGQPSPLSPHLTRTRGSSCHGALSIRPQQ
jgi:hypothetical protein